jgi:hypothetical protein
MKRIAVLTIAATLIIANWISPSDKPQAGQPCAPDHHWSEQPTNVLNTELQCSPD